MATQDLPIPGSVYLVDVREKAPLAHAGSDHTIVLSPTPSDDVNDPLNWPRWRKIMAISCVFVYITTSGIGACSIYSILQPISDDTGIPLSTLNAGTGYMFLLLGWGALFNGPIALAYGKRGIYIISLLGNMCMCIWAPFIKTEGQWLASKVLQGFLNTPIESLCEVSIADVFFAHERGTWIGLYTLFLFGSNYLAPVLAGFIYDGQGWHWVMWWSAIINAGGAIFLFFFMEETTYTRKKSEAAERHEADKLADDREKSAIEMNVDASSKKASFDEASSVTGSLKAPDGRTLVGTPKTYLQRLAVFNTKYTDLRTLFTMVWRPVILMRFPSSSGKAGFSYGTCLVWYNVLNATASLILSAPPYNFRASFVGLCYIGPIIGVIFSSLYSGWLSDKFVLAMARRNGGVREPEHRLWLMIVCVLLCPASLILWGVGASRGVSWGGLVVGMGIIACSTGVGSALSLGYALDSYKDLSGEVMMTIIIVRNTLSFAIGYGITPWLHMGLQNTFITAAFVGLAVTLTFLIVIRFGKGWRASSKELSGAREMRSLPHAAIPPPDGPDTFRTPNQLTQTSTCLRLQIHASTPSVLISIFFVFSNMPPRKKAVAADASVSDQPARATRASTRKASASQQPAAVTASQTNAAPAAQAKDAPKSKAKVAPTSKGKAKRTRPESDDDNNSDQPDTKKAKADDNADAASSSKKDVSPPKMVTVIKRGAAPVDALSGYIDTHQVLSNAEGIWDAMLNQTDYGKNANKFYVIQVLHAIGNTTDSILFTRWGRVGENGQSMKKGPFSHTTAVSEFKKQFKAKTGVAWEQRHGMIAKKGKYTWLERSFDDEEDPKEEKGKEKSDEGESPESEKIPDCTLAAEIQTLCRLIFSSKLIEAHLSSMNYDANKLPLGKLAKSTILNGFAALKALSEVLSQPDGDIAEQLGGYRTAVEDLTGRYYSIIPHAFGRNRPTVIDSLDLLKRELELVDALGDMEVASKLIASAIPKDKHGQAINPIDAHFRSLRLSVMDPITRDSREFAALQAYAHDTHGVTHQYYRVEVQQAFRVERQEETDAWMKSGFHQLADGERLLLWHGSRTTNFAGIAYCPPEAPATDDVQICKLLLAGLSDNTGLLLLCEVAAKPFFEQQGANYKANVDCKAANKLCTKGIGRTQPVEWQDAGETLNNDALRGCHMPKGPGQDVSNPGYLQYNEYIVYDPSQIRLRYLLMVKMG
ncbi:Poly [ADP-ribose] polymerase 2 [Grifola frondosa]|uniref:Poly [ADP-ribose] polymerase n=1 Tax=Grifola frondosa TaxID=5627 RepID=A0A1C7MQZ1_GRIFR|nr:Poly [ADP-ribose] polymerase 2 [Grifola frondosa]